MNIAVVIDGLGAEQTFRAVDSLLKRIREPAPRTLGIVRDCIVAPDTHHGTVDTVYEGADSYKGHFELVGVPARSTQVFVADALEKIESVLGSVRTIASGVLLSASGTLIANNIEADRGSTINVISSPECYDVVREDCKTLEELIDANRVIAMTSDDAVQCIEKWRDGYDQKDYEGGTVSGIVPGRLGLYENGYRCTHIGRGLRQYPSWEQSLLGDCTSKGKNVILIGKVCDIFDMYGVDGVTNRPCVTTDATTRALSDAIAAREADLVICNFQQFDLACHVRDRRGAASNLFQICSGIDEAVRWLHPEDKMVITADHGNDPAAPGNSHTKEKVPMAVLGTIEGLSLYGNGGSRGLGIVRELLKVTG